jgi:DNA repair protein RadC
VTGRNADAERSTPGELDAVLARAWAAGRVDGPVTFAWCMQPASDGKTREHAWVAVLGPACEMLSISDLGEDGRRASVGLDLGDVVEAARRERARYAILAHNHPSGDAQPSEQDAALTWAADDAARRQGVVLLDHVVLGAGQVYSFREGRLWQIRSSPSSPP